MPNSCMVVVRVNFSKLLMCCSVDNLATPHFSTLSVIDEQKSKQEPYLHC